MRGLIPAHIMARIETVTGLRMADMVDIFCGPSTGAILNAGLNVPHSDHPDRPKYRAKHMVRFYEQEGENIFPPDRFRAFRGLIHDFNNRTMRIGQLRNLFRHGHYSPAYLSLALDKLYGQTRLSETLRSLIIPIYNLDGDQLQVVEDVGDTSETPVHTKNNFVDQGGYAVWLKNIQGLEMNTRRPPDVTLKNAILASTAAPTFFPCHHFDVTYPDERGKISYSGIDGSIFDNPPISYHGAISPHLHEDTELHMILLGTGHTLRSFKKEDWNRFGGLGVVDPVNDLPLINILFHASETALVESFGEELGQRIYVFNKSMVRETDQSIVPSFQIDDASPHNLKKMEHFAHATIEENQKQFDHICDLLVRNYEQRQKQKPFWRRWF